MTLPPDYVGSRRERLEPSEQPCHEANTPGTVVEKRILFNSNAVMRGTLRLTATIPPPPAGPGALFAYNFIDLSVTPADYYGSLTQDFQNSLSTDITTQQYALGSAYSFLRWTIVLLEMNTPGTITTSLNINGVDNATYTIALMDTGVGGVHLITGPVALGPNDLLCYHFNVNLGATENTATLLCGMAYV